jgi:hypothetical protein
MLRSFCYGWLLLALLLPVAQVVRAADPSSAAQLNQGAGKASATARWPVPREIGWVALFNNDLIAWLEQHPLDDALCAGLSDDEGAWKRCRRAAAKTMAIDLPLWPSARRSGQPIGTLRIVAYGGAGVAAFYVPPRGGEPIEFEPDLLDGDWGYGPYFNQTYLARDGEWFQLPADPFPSTVWISAKDLGNDAASRLVEAGDLITLPIGQVVVLRIEPGALIVRPEQPADMWCDAPPEPPLAPWKPIRIPRKELYTATGHLRIGITYARGC